MRITVCAAFYPPYRGGYAESVRLLAEGLAERGHAVTVVACSICPASTRTESGVIIRSVPAWNPAFLHGSFPIPNPFAFWRALQCAGRTDIISTQTRFFPSTLIGFIFGKWHGIPVVHTERGAAYASSDNFLIRACALFADRTAGWLVCRFSDGVIGVSDAAADFTCRLGARSPITIYNGIDVGWWRRPDGFFRSVTFPRIVFVGRLVHAKGVQDLLYAIPPLVSEFSGLSVAIVGDGPHRSALDRLAHTLGIGRSVIFYGALPSCGVREILWQSDVLVNPSHSEGFPRSVLEAAAVGMPIVATDVGGTREVAGEGVLLISPKNIPLLTDALRSVLRDGALCAHMTRAAQAAPHSTEHMAESYEKYFSSYGIL